MSGGKKRAIAAALAVVATYLAVSFVKWDANAAHWEGVDRATCAFMSFFAAVVSQLFPGLDD
jgi:hypothetical protein